MAKKQINTARFKMLGGTRQLLIRTGDDVRRVMDLDVALWAMTGTQADSLVCDPAFLKLLDHDNSNRIRCDEVKGELRWMLSILKDLSGMEQHSDVLAVDALYDDTPEALKMREAIRVAMENLGIAEKKSISLAEISNHEKIVSASLQNGDGIIPPDQVKDPLTAECIRAIMALIGKQKDLSGIDGVGAAETDSFEALAKGYLAWRDAYEAEPEKMLPFGDKTAALYQAQQAIAEKTDAFFRSVSALKFGNAKFTASATTFDPLDAATVSSFLEKSPIVNPAPDAVLNAGPDVNPLWHDRVAAFLDACSGVFGKKIEQMNEAEWNALKVKLAPYGAWITSKNTDLFDAFDLAKLRAFVKEDSCGKIRTLIQNDIAVANNLSDCRLVEKLIIYQKYMLDFLNNFVSLHNLFDEEVKSMIQVGRLVMDGRVFTLCTPVPNPAEHKKIVEKSDICSLYIDITTGIGDQKKAMKLAVAVTSGDVRNIFVGKSGVFYTDDGTVWDAKVFDFVKQPVSISEALKEPFYKFGEFLQKQADKFFATKSKTYEDNMAKSIQTTMAKPTAPQPPPVNGSMLLMGGGIGIGIAAISSAIAFIAKSLQGISAWSVIGVILGILLIFGGPVIFISLVKLYHRNLSRFFEANGFAMNMQMRLSLKMGRVFTYKPKMPLRIQLFRERLGILVNRGDSGNSKGRWIFCVILLLALLAAAAYFSHPYWACCKAFILRIFHVQ